MGTHYRGTAAEVRALDAYIKLTRACVSVQRRLDRALRGSGLKERQLGVLEILYHLGPLDHRQIGAKLLVSRANITLLVDQLTARGLVRRVPDTMDRRRVTVRLTPEGVRRVEKVLPPHVGTIVETFSVLEPRDQAELGRLCKKLGRACAGPAGVPRGTKTMW
jgi:MarR family 2-MHQ and catechol resistance regulon transcriptional repressor